MNTAMMDQRMENLLSEARFAYLGKNYILAWALVSAAQSVIAERQAAEDKANGKAAANRID